jgi:hypothetical protein
MMALPMARWLLLVILLGSCHDGAAGGSGKPCSLHEPCRAAFVCVADKCQPVDSVGAGAGKTCKHSQPFTTVDVVPDIHWDPGTFDDAAQLTADELRIYFTSSRSGSYQIFEGWRFSRFTDFIAVGTARLIGPVPAFNPSLTADGQIMFVEWSMESGGSVIGTSTSVMPGGDWTVPLEFAPLAHVAPIADGRPYVLPKGDVLYFQSNREGGVHVFRTARDGSGTWSSPELASGFSQDSELAPVVAADDLTMYFASDRGKAAEALADGGAPEPGDYDIWVATRQTREEAFGSPTRVEGVNTTMGETPSWISPDACRLYFARRIGNTNESAIYLAERTTN